MGYAPINYSYFLPLRFLCYDKCAKKIEGGNILEQKERIRQIAAEKASAIADMNHCVWSYAEYGYQERQSAAKLMDTLRAEGFQVESGIAGIETAFVARWGSGKPVIGILAEYDALPGLSQQAGVAKPEPIPGKEYGHGCGHSALGAGSVGAAIVAKTYLEKNPMSGTIELYGCPAEETGFGKAFMTRAGCFDHLDMAFSWHPYEGNACWGTRSVAYYKVRFRFKGITAHAGGNPEMGRSALDACELMNVGVNYLREHIISSARVHYAYLDCGGEAPNVVQDHAALLYFVRAPKLHDCAEILDRIKDIARGAALMTGTTVEIKVLGGLSDNIPNPTASQLLSDCFVECGGPDFGEEEFAIARRFLQAMPEKQRAQVVAAGAKANGVSQEEFAEHPLSTVVMPYSPAMRNIVATGSTDVGDVSYRVPTAQLMGATAIPGTVAHTWQMTAQVGTSIGDKCCEAVARAIALACVRLCEQPALADQARRELLEETGGAYESPLPDDVLPGEGM